MQSEPRKTTPTISRASSASLLVLVPWWFVFAPTGERAVARRTPESASSNPKSSFTGATWLLLRQPSFAQPIVVVVAVLRMLERAYAYHAGDGKTRVETEHLGCLCSSLLQLAQLRMGSRQPAAGVEKIRSSPARHRAATATLRHTARSSSSLPPPRPVPRADKTDLAAYASQLRRWPSRDALQPRGRRHSADPSSWGSTQWPSRMRRSTRPAVVAKAGRIRGMRGLVAS